MCVAVCNCNMVEKNILSPYNVFFNTNDILLQAIRSIGTDNAPAMLGNQSRFVTLMKNEIAEVEATHCIFHRQALA